MKMKNLKSLYSTNIELKNPLIAASCGLTGTAEKLKKLEDSGVGSAVMKSLFEDEKCREDPTPRYKIIERGKGITSFSRFAGLDIDVDNEIPVMHGGYAGHGGSWSLLYALWWISKLFLAVKISVSGSGGIQDGKDVVKFIIAGASTAQLCTVLYHEGYDVIKKFISELEEFMDKKGYTGINDFKGTIHGKILSMHRIDRIQRVKVTINSSLCNKCGICEKICNFNAIDIINKKEYIVIDDLCSGCGLCVEICPKKAIIFYTI